MNHTLDDFVWHDAVFRGLSIDTQDSHSGANCRIRLLAYCNPHGSVRYEVEIIASSLLSFASSIDFVELADNAGAGNVSNGYVKRISSKTRGHFDVLRIYLADGYIEATAPTIQLATIGAEEK